MLEGAAREAARFHAEEIGTEHILIAMMKGDRVCGIPPFKYP
ncbi:MAG: Clp protease N-terminal domain-containing protein [Agathobacter rectalis]